MYTKWWVIISVIVVAIIAVIGITTSVVGFYVNTHNEIVVKDVAVKAAYGNLESQYQSRADLLPNLINVTMSSAKFESKTQTEVAGLRSQAITGQQMMKNAQTVEDMQSANGMIENTLSRLMVVVESYPELKTTEAFTNLQSEFEGRENRVTNARRKYNEAAEAYETYVSKIPENFVAGYDGYKSDKWPMFKAKTGTDVAPIIPVMET
jgi:LemA protein